MDILGQKGDRRRGLILTLVLLAACASHTVPLPTSPPRSEALPSALLWARTAAEHHAAYLQAYRSAAERVRAEAAKHQRGMWGVILDVDETVLDNSAFEREQEGKPYDDQAFLAWCRREESRALPGTKDLLDLVHRLGGRIVFVTNRAEVVCDPTRRNLRKEGLPFDEVLCSPGGDDKNPRFQAVERGQPPSTLPSLTVVLWVGDNIQDFPALRQATMRDAGDEAFSSFGEKYFILPNPVYGSWTKNPMR